MENIEDLHDLIVGKVVFSETNLPTRIAKSLAIYGNGVLLRYIYDIYNYTGASFSKSFLDTYLVSGRIYKYQNILYLLTLEKDEIVYYIMLEAV